MASQSPDQVRRASIRNLPFAIAMWVIAPVGGALSTDLDLGVRGDVQIAACAIAAFVVMEVFALVVRPFVAKIDGRGSPRLLRALVAIPSFFFGVYVQDPVVAAAVVAGVLFAVCVVGIWVLGKTRLDGPRA